MKFNAGDHVIFHKVNIVPDSSIFTRYTSYVSTATVFVVSNICIGRAPQYALAFIDAADNTAVLAEEDELVLAVGYKPKKQIRSWTMK